MSKENSFGLYFGLLLGIENITPWHLSARTDGSPTPAVGDHLRSRHSDSPLTLRDQARRASESFSSKDAAEFEFSKLNNKN